MRSMVEGFFQLRRTPPPHFVRSPSPANAGEDLYAGPILNTQNLLPSGSRK
jgi:hypothetical protein